MYIWHHNHYLRKQNYLIIIENLKKKKIIKNIRPEPLPNHKPKKRPKRAHTPSMQAATLMNVVFKKNGFFPPL